MPKLPDLPVTIPGPSILYLLWFPIIEVEPTTGEWVLTQEDKDAGAEDLATDKTEIIFRPNVNRQEEKIKVLIIKNEAETI